MLQKPEKPGSSVPKKKRYSERISTSVPRQWKQRFLRALALDGRTVGDVLRFLAIRWTSFMLGDELRAADQLVAPRKKENPPATPPAVPPKQSD